MTPSPKCETCGKAKCEIHLDLQALHTQVCRAIFCHGHSEDDGKKCGGMKSISCSQAHAENDIYCAGGLHPCPSCKPEDKTDFEQLEKNIDAILEERPTPTPDARKGEGIKIDEELVRRVVKEADLDQLALVLFHECRHQPESGKGIERIRKALAQSRLEGAEVVAKKMCEAFYKKGSQEGWHMTHLGVLWGAMYEASELDKLENHVDAE